MAEARPDSLTRSRAAKPAGEGAAFSPLYRQIKELLVQSLDRGEWKPGELIPSEIDLAARFQVSQGTVRKAVDELAAEHLLLRRQGQILSRTTLAEQVWDMNFDSDTNVIDVAIRRLRGKLDDPYDAKLLHTVRGMGYVLESRPS
ncbi:winged helix-turn-helix domain-containing protein [Bordetella pertussis]